MKIKRYLTVILILGIAGILIINTTGGAHKTPAEIFKSKFPKFSVHLIKRILYSLIAADYATEYLYILTNNLETFILMNPPPNNPIILDVIRFFVSLLQPFYILAIVITGFYLILLSSSPSGRTKAKSTILKLIISLTLISLTPYILKILFFLTKNIAESILAQSNVEYFKFAFNAVIDKLKLAHQVAALINIEFGYYTFLPMFLTVWGIYIILILRYMALILWIIFFPVAIFLYSFNFTKNIGRNILEQTILWSFLQVFNALIIATATVCMISKPHGFMDLQIFMGYGIDILMVVGVIGLGLAPAVMLVWFRNFLP